MEFETIWKRSLEPIISSVFFSSHQRSEWMLSFELIHSLCTARPDPYHERLYEALRNFLRDYVRSICQRLTNIGEPINAHGDVSGCEQGLFSDSIKFLHAYASEWRRFSDASTNIDRMFLYVNNHFVENARLEQIDTVNVCLGSYGDDDQPLVPVGRLCVLMWHAELLSNAPIRDALKRALSTVVSNDRLLETSQIAVECIATSPLGLPLGATRLNVADREAISVTVRSLIETDITVETADDVPYEASSFDRSRRLIVPVSSDAFLKTYRTVCEVSYFEETSAFYSRFADALTNEPHAVTSAAYARVMLQLIEAEQRRAEMVLDKSSVETALERARAVSLTDRLDFLFADVRVAIETSKVEELRTLFNLLRPIRSSPAGFDRLVNAFQTHVERVGYADLCTLRSGDEMQADARKPAPRGSSAEFVTRFVERLLDLFSRLTDKFVRNTFASDQSFVAALDKAFNNLVNFRWTKLQQAAAESGGWAAAASASAMSVDDAPPSVATGKAPAGFPPHCSSAELLARYCDMLLRGTPIAPGMQRTEANASETDARLGQCVTLFRYVDDKDLFQKHYAKFLSRRLVTAPSASSGGINMELEESMVNRLKQLCGFQYTHRFACMFKDVQVAKDMTIKFDGFVENLKRGGTGPVSESASTTPTSDAQRQEADRAVTVTGSAEDAQRATELVFATSWYVLQANSWPIASVNIPSVLLPTPIQNVIQLFESFYRKSQSGRKLTWLPQYSTVELRANFAKRSYLVSMSAFHATILWQFNTADSYTVGELRQLTSLNQTDLTACLRTLIDQKLLVLQVGVATSFSAQSAAGSDLVDMNEGEMEVDAPTSAPSVSGVFSEETRVEINANYANKRAKFRLPLFVHKEVTQETSEMVRQRVDEDRKLCLQAAVVRVMKSKKVMRHTELINEILSIGKSLHFTPSVVLIKRCIEILIEKQYLQRSPNSQDEYQYLA